MNIRSVFMMKKRHIYVKMSNALLCHLDCIS